MKTVLCIFRAACFSPGMVERDEAILRAVASRLQATGYTVSLIHEEELSSDTSMPVIALHMARSSRALDILMRWEDAGCHVLNPVDGVRNVERETLARLCAEQAIPTPKTWIVATANHGSLMNMTTEGHADSISFPCWVKRTGSCAQQAGDVRLVHNIEEYKHSLISFHDSHIDKAIVMEHLEGPCIKFYAVRGTDFFYHLPTACLGYDKWNNGSMESVKYDTGENTHSLEYSERPFLDMVTELVAMLQEDDRHELPVIYGGDAIMGSDGIARLIDLNDWPSFSACREAAAAAIAQLVIKM